MHSLIWVAHLPMFGDCSSTMFASLEQPKSQCNTHERCLCSYFFAPEYIVPDIEWFFSWSSNVHFSCFSVRPSERAPKVPSGQHEQWGRCVLLISPRFVNSTSTCSYILISILWSYLWVISNLYHGNLTMAMVPATIWPKDRGWWCLTRPELFRCDLTRGGSGRFHGI